jgi:excinuclease ABC subunit A
MEAVIPDINLSVKEGGIAPLGIQRDAYMFRNVEVLAKKHKINLDKAIKDLPAASLNILLYGNTEGSSLELENIEDDIASNPYEGEFEGIIPMLKRWFVGVNSEGLREWVEQFMQLKTCTACNGQRLKKESCWFKIDEKNIAELSNLNLDKLHHWFNDIEKRLNKKQNLIAKDILKEIRERVQFLLDVGLTYLSLNRPSRSLSGGESQRIRLATQIGSQLQGITYILDEPSIGLHQRDNQQLIHALKNLRNIGNSILVVEHDKDIMMAADHLVDIGPKAGKYGGHIVSAGTPEEVLRSNSETAQYLSGKKSIAIPSERRSGNGKSLQLNGASGNNLRNVNVNFPLGKLNSQK